jgi:hypothetical protein
MLSRPISYEARLPLEWQYLQDPPDAEQIESSQKNNLECLKQAILLDELANINTDDNTVESSDASRTEKKLDLLLSLVSALIEKQKTSDSITLFRLTSNTIEWEYSGLKESALLAVEVFIHAGSLTPMQLFCESIRNHESTCQTKLLYMHDSVQELLEKYIFLTHRRKVAAEKKRLQF